MHIDYCKSDYKGKKNISILLRETYRDNGKIKHRTILNLTNYPKEEIEAMKLAFKFKDNLAQLGNIQDIKISNKYIFAPTYVLYQIANQLGITKVLGNSQEAKQILWLIISQIIKPSSKCGAVRLANIHAAPEVIGLENFNEDNLYKSLNWLSENQQKFEQQLFNFRYKNSEPNNLFLYDVTSSYFEGWKNYFARFGYNRDKKKSKKQMVIGLLTDKVGFPVSVKVFDGNTSDVKTFGNQVNKVKNDFNAKNVIFIGDKGMIKSDEKKLCLENEFSYITTITKPQIQSLIDKKIIQLSMFDKNLKELIIEDENKIFVNRYLLRRNPIRAKEFTIQRREKYNTIINLLNEKITYLKEHKRASINVAFNEIDKKIKKLKLNWLSIEIIENKVIVNKIEVIEKRLKLTVNKKILKEIAKFDGCYVVETNLKKEDCEAKEVHVRYKDLAKVENAFKQIKTEHLEVRPTYVQTEQSTTAHVFICMLSYMILFELNKAWKNEELKVSEILEKLKTITTQEIKNGDKIFYKISEPDELSKKFLSKINIEIPIITTNRKFEIYTKKERLKKEKSNLST